MADAVIKQLEDAAQIMLAPPNMVTTDQRHAAENVFLQFKKSPMPYEMCRHILDNCSNGYVVFQASQTIKEAVVREWTLLSPGDVENLRSFLLHYVTRNIGIESYVREQVLQTVAVIFKRGTIDTEGVNREALFNDITQLINSGNVSMQLVACSILSAILNEYSSTNRSSNVGLTWEFHSKCKLAFEQNELKKVFLFCLQVLSDIQKMEGNPGREATMVLNRFLSITEHCLSWEFLPRHMTRRYVGSFMSNQAVSFKPPATWRDSILDKGLLHLMFRIHAKVRFNSEMAHHSLQCLAQLASINGNVFADQKFKTEFLSNYLQTFLDMIRESDLQDYEALGVAQVINNLLLHFPLSVFLALPPQLLHTFIHSMAKLTCSFSQSSAQDEAMHKDDSLYPEAYEKVLESWLTFIQGESELPAGSLKPHAIEVFNAYVQCHLSPPDGTRNQGCDGYVADDEDEYDEVDEDDREHYKDQLCAIGAFARLVPQHSIPLITRLLEDRVTRLHGQLQRIQQTTSPGQHTFSADTVLNSINEDLHWLLLIAGNTLTENAEGETPLIPEAVMRYSISEAGSVDVSTTLAVLAASPTSQPAQVPGGEQHTDYVVRLVSAVLRLCEVEKRAQDHGLTNLSPQVGSSLMWFLERWVRAYLLYQDDLYSQVSVALSSSFGKHTDGGRWLINHIMDKVLANLAGWNSEENLINDTLNLFIALVDKRDRATHLIKSPSLWKLAKDMSGNQRPVDMLPANSRRLLCKALVLAGSAAFDANTEKENYWQLVLQSVQERLGCVLSQGRVEGSRVTEVLCLLGQLCGLADGTTGSNVNMLHRFLQPALQHCIHILNAYHSYDEVVKMVLEVFNTIAKRQICYLGADDTKKVYEVTLSMIQTYAKHNIGGKAFHADAEEEQFADLLILMELLTDLLSKEFVDFGITGSEKSLDSSSVVNAADVVLYGLDIIVPFMNAELLKFPALCTSYMRLITYIAEIYPEKIDKLPEALLKSLYASVEIGMASSFGTDIIKMCLEFVTSMATHVYYDKNNGVQSDAAMEHFLKMVFKMLLVETFDMDLLETASACFYALICCHQARYEALVNELLSEQNEPSYYQRLAQAFHELTPTSHPLSLDRQGKITFMQSFDKFLVNVRGFLCVK